MAHTIKRAAVVKAFRARLLLARPDDGSDTLAERLRGGLHIGSPPDNADYQYGAMRGENLQRRNIDGPFFRLEVLLDLFHRPRSEAEALRETTDTAVAVAVGWCDLAVGISNVEVLDSDEVPPFSESKDPEVIRTRTRFALDLHPAP